MIQRRKAVAEMLELPSAFRSSFGAALFLQLGVDEHTGCTTIRMPLLLALCVNGALER